MHKRAMSRFLVEKFFSHRTETFRRGTLLCFKKFLLSKNSMDKGGGREYHDFSSKICCHTVPKNFPGELFPVSEKFWYRNSSCIRRAASRFSVVNIRLKNVSKGWDSNPYHPFQNPDVLPTVPWEQLQIPTNVSEIVKISDTAEIRTRAYRFRTLFPTHCAMGTIGIKFLTNVN